MTEIQFYSRLHHRDADDYPYDINGNRLPLKDDPDFTWTTEPNDVSYSGSVYQLAYNRGAY